MIAKPASHIVLGDRVVGHGPVIATKLVGGFPADPAGRRIRLIFDGVPASILRGWDEDVELDTIDAPTSGS